MPVSSRKVARQLATRLQAAIPPSLTIRAEGELVNLYDGDCWVGGSGAAVIINDEDGRTVLQKLETAAEAVLSGIQDGVTEHLTEPWPKGATGGMAIPGARADERRVNLWYGEERAPTVEFRPIDLAEVAE